MFGSGILDLVIGLIFIYFIVSLICSAIREIFANTLNLRFHFMRKWAAQALNESLGAKLMNHRLVRVKDTAKSAFSRWITTLTGFNLSKSSYIPKDIFSSALLDILKQEVGENGKPYNLQELRDKVLAASSEIPEDLKRVFQQYAEEAVDIDGFKQKIENWFDHSMNGLKEVYRQWSQFWIFVIALFVTIGLNVDSIAISKYLYENPEERKAFADFASNIAQDSVYAKKVAKIRSAELNPDQDTTIRDGDTILLNIQLNLEEIEEYKALIEGKNLPLGWPDGIEEAFTGDSQKDLPKKLPGWIITIFAVSVGAPFWFDLLKKVANLRASVQNSSTTSK